MNWLKRGVATLVAVALLACSIIAASVSAAFANETCETGFGDRVPVVQVHGLDSDSEIWDSMGEELEEINEIFPERFDYRAASKEWVTHEDIGPKLARFIDCLAQASLEGGGKGKVIILAHSMGGLATRYAVNEAVDDRLVADEVGLVITIGTPHYGSDMAQLCEWFSFAPKCDGTAPLAMKPGSEELANLPEFPDSIPVRAIAGDVTIHDELFNAEYTLDLDSDSVVGVDSATAFYSETGVGDDKRRFECDGTYDRVLTIVTGVEASCEHTTMLSTDYVQDDVVQGVETYLASQQVEETDFYGLQLTLPPEWTVDTGPEADYLYSEIQYHNQDYCPPGGRYCPLVTVFDNSTSKWQDLDTIHIEDGVLVAEYDCRGSAYLPPEFVKEVDVGGEAAQLYEHVSCPEYDGIPHKRSWVILSRQMVITDQSGSDGSRSEGFDEILANATWS